MGPDANALAFGGVSSLLKSLAAHRRSCRAAKFLSDEILASTGADKFAVLSEIETGQQAAMGWRLLHCFQVWRCKLKAAGYVWTSKDPGRWSGGRWKDTSFPPRSRRGS